MKFFIRCLLGLVLVISSQVHAADIVVENAYINAPPPVIKVAAGFFTIHNHSDKAITLEKFSSPVAGTVELHESTTVDGMMKMRKLPSLEIAAHDMAELKPGAKHLMLIKLNSKLKPGDKKTIQLTFSDGSQVTVEAEIRDRREAHHKKETHHHH